MYVSNGTLTHLPMWVLEVQIVLLLNSIRFSHYSAWGRCYDQNFLRFLPIFGEKIDVFLKHQCYDQIFAKNSSSLGKKRQYSK
jgi:hypothetical protein